MERAVKSASKDYQEGFDKETNAPQWSYYLLGKAYNKNYQFDKAASTFAQYKIALTEADSVTLADINHQIKIANSGKN